MCFYHGYWVATVNIRLFWKFASKLCLHSQVAYAFWWPVHCFIVNFHCEVLVMTISKKIQWHCTILIWNIHLCYWRNEMALYPANITNQKSQLCFTFVFDNCQLIYIKNKLNICKRYIITILYKILRLRWQLCTIVFAVLRNICECGINYMQQSAWNVRVCQLYKYINITGAG